MTNGEISKIILVKYLKKYGRRVSSFRSLLPVGCYPPDVDAWNQRLIRHPDIRNRVYYACDEIVNELSAKCIFAIHQKQCACVYVLYTNKNIGATYIMNYGWSIDAINFKNDVFQRFAADIITGYSPMEMEKRSSLEPE